MSNEKSREDKLLKKVQLRQAYRRRKLKRKTEEQHKKFKQQQL